jgi:hypothetical protein
LVRRVGVPASMARDTARQIARSTTVCSPAYLDR